MNVALLLNGSHCSLVPIHQVPLNKQHQVTTTTIQLYRRQDLLLRQIIHTVPVVTLTSPHTSTTLTQPGVHRVTEPSPFTYKPEPRTPFYTTLSKCATTLSASTPAATSAGSPPSGAATTPLPTSGVNPMSPTSSTAPTTFVVRIPHRTVYTLVPQATC